MERLRLRFEDLSEDVDESRDSTTEQVGNLQRRSLRLSIRPRWDDDAAAQGWRCPKPRPVHRALSGVSHWRVRASVEPIASIKRIARRHRYSG